ncbi:MAG: radical SAM protein [bacterium]|nr:radical SAM protein [bacterium]
MLCPRACGVERETHVGFCGAPAQPVIARAALHFWEEPPISGTRGSGAIFFCGCNLDCLFCQNHEINHASIGREWSADELAALMLHLQAEGAHNINLVTPTPHIETIIPAVRRAREQGLQIPIVYNTNGYETIETLHRLEGVVDIYLPDLKYTSALPARKYSGAEDYFRYAGPAVVEMHRQCGELVCDENGIARRGLIVRHLVLPGSVDETRRILDFLAENLPLTTHISLMGQYMPCHRASEIPPLNRKLLRREYDRAIAYCIQLGFEHVSIQSLDASDAAFVPEFNGDVTI